MKRYLLIFALMLGVVCSFAQSKTDQAAVLQKIIDLTDLQQYYPKSPDGIDEKVYIVQQPVAFPAGIQLSKFGQPVQFIDNAGILDNLSVAYFVFQTFTITGNTADVTFDFYYTYTTNKALFQCSALLNKNDDTWTISNAKLNRR
jgi:hypothetical protein